MRKNGMVCAIIIIQLVIICIVVDFCGMMLLKSVPDKGCGVVKDNYSLNRTNADIVIVGSCRASHNYVSKILQDGINKTFETNYKVYNAGNDAHFINSQSCIVESILERYSPKLIIWEAEEISLRRDVGLELPLALYHSNAIFDKYIDDLGFVQKMKAVIPLYRYSGQIVKLLFEGVNADKYDGTGYEPLYGVKDVQQNKEMEIKNCDGPVIAYNERHFRQALSKCKKNNVEVIVVHSPNYRKYANSKYLKSICKEYNVKILDYRCDEYFNEHPEFFYDEGHLNNDGAIVFSNKLADVLKHDSVFFLIE